MLPRKFRIIWSVAHIVQRFILWLWRPLHSIKLSLPKILHFRKLCFSEKLVKLHFGVPSDMKARYVSCLQFFYHFFPKRNISNLSETCKHFVSVTNSLYVNFIISMISWKGKWGINFTSCFYKFCSLGLQLDKR